MSGWTHLLYRAGVTAGFGVASLPGIRQLVAAGLRPRDTVLARAYGEDLATRACRVLALTCHPDDLEFFAGGTLRRLALSGSEIIAGVLTDGEKGGNRPALGEVRRSEMKRCAALLGYKRLEFCGLTDYGLPEDPRLEREVTRLWQEVRPDVVLAFDPLELMPYMANRDHKALGRAVADLARHYVGDGVQVYFYGTRHPNVLVDISAVIDDKIGAVLTHQSQLIYLPRALYDDLVRYYGQVSAGGACAYAEGLYRLI